MADMTTQAYGSEVTAAMRGEPKHGKPQIA
jgi:hypothetical protein